MFAPRECSCNILMAFYALRTNTLGTECKIRVNDFLIDYSLSSAYLPAACLEPC